MSADLFRQLRRVEAQAERGFEGTAAESAERRRRLRLELLRQHLAQNVDFLKAAGSSEVRLELKDPQSAGQLRPAEGDDYKYRYIVMPMRI